MRIEFNHRYENVESEFAIFNVARGRYHFDEGLIRLTTSSNRPVDAQVSVIYGSFFDGTSLQIDGKVTARFSKYVQTSLIYLYDDLHLPGGDEPFHTLRDRLSLFFTPDISWVTLVQYDNVSDTIGANSRFRWIIEDGREVFSVLNQDFDTRDEIRPGRTEPLVKLEWTFRF